MPDVFTTFSLGHGFLPIVGAPNRHRLVVGFGTNPFTGEQQITNLDPFLVVSRHLAVHLAAVATVHISEDRDRMPDRPFGTEHHHIFLVDGVDDLAPQLTPSAIGQVGMGIQIENVALHDKASIRAQIQHLTADHHLIQPGNRRRLNAVRFFAIEGGLQSAQIWRGQNRR